MHQPQTNLPQNSMESHPFLIFSDQENDDDRAKKLKDFLVNLSKRPEAVEYKSILQRAATAIREQRFGISTKKIESKLKAVFEEYFDGEVYCFLEIDNLSELTGIAEKYLEPVLEKMIAKGLVETEQRRRYQEFGKHYNTLYRFTGKEDK